MIHKKISVKIGEHHPTAEITTYMIGNSEELYDGRLRPLIIICPGGGYEMTSDREAEGIAFAKKLEEVGSLSLFNNIEMPLVPVLAQMQFNGMLVDESELSREEKEIMGVFRERGEICMAEVEKLLRRKDVYVAVRALLEKEIIGIKESMICSSLKLNVW